MGTLVAVISKNSKLAKALDAQAKDKEYQKKRKERFDAFSQYEEEMIANIVVTDRPVQDRISRNKIPVGSKALRIDIVAGNCTVYYTIERAKKLLKKLAEQMKKPMTRAEMKECIKRGIG